MKGSRIVSILQALVGVSIIATAYYDFSSRSLVIQTSADEVRTAKNVSFKLIENVGSAKYTYSALRFDNFLAEEQDLFRDDQQENRAAGAETKTTSETTEPHFLITESNTTESPNLHLTSTSPELPEKGGTSSEPDSKETENLGADLDHGNHTSSAENEPTAPAENSTRTHSTAESNGAESPNLEINTTFPESQKRREITSEQDLTAAMSNDTDSAAPNQNSTLPSLSEKSESNTTSPELRGRTPVETSSDPDATKMDNGTESAAPQQNSSSSSSPETSASNTTEIGFINDVPITIVTRLIGESSNWLKFILRAKAIQIELEEKYRIQSHFRFRTKRHFRNKKQCMQTIGVCYPNLKSFHFRDNLDLRGAHMEIMWAQDAWEKQHNITPKSLAYPFNDGFAAPEDPNKFDELHRLLVSGVNVTTGAQDVSVPHIENEGFISYELMNRYYDRFRDYLTYDESHPHCCQLKPDDDATVWVCANSSITFFHHA